MFKIIAAVAFVVVGIVFLLWLILLKRFASDPNQAIMPDQFLITRLDQVKEGQEVFISKNRIELDDNRKIWVSKSAGAGEIDSDESILVKKTGKYFEVKFSNSKIKSSPDSYKFKPGDGHSYYSVYYFPVSKLTIVENFE